MFSDRRANLRKRTYELTGKAYLVSHHLFDYSSRLHGLQGFLETLRLFGKS